MVILNCKLKNIAALAITMPHDFFFFFEKKNYCRKEINFTTTLCLIIKCPFKVSYSILPIVCMPFQSFKTEKFCQLLKWNIWHKSHNKDIYQHECIRIHNLWRVRCSNKVKTHWNENNTLGRWTWLGKLISKLYQIIGRKHELEADKIFTKNKNPRNKIGQEK